MTEIAKAVQRRNAALKEVEDLADLLDTKFSILGLRFGVDGILGLLPGIGDAASLIVGLYLVAVAVRAGASFGLVCAMLMRLALDTVLGLVPVLGDIADVFYKANARNAKMLRKALEKQNVAQIEP